MLEDRMVDSFLNEVPLAPLPSGFTRSVMARIENERKVVRFRLDFTDLAVPVFLSLFATLLFSILMVVIVLIPPFWLVRLEMQIQPLIWSLPESTFLVGAIIVSLIGLSVIVLLGITGILWLRPATSLMQNSQPA